MSEARPAILEAEGLSKTFRSGQEEVLGQAALLVDEALSS